MGKIFVAKFIFQYCFCIETLIWVMVAGDIVIFGYKLHFEL